MGVGINSWNSFFHLCHEYLIFSKCCVTVLLEPNYTQYMNIVNKTSVCHLNKKLGI